MMPDREHSDTEPGSGGEESTTNRRAFLQLVGCGAVAAIVTPTAVAQAAGGTIKVLAVSLDQVPQITQVGGSVVVKIAGVDVLFIRNTETQVIALNAICTHKHCIVGYKPKAHDIQCHCHHSVYSLTGQVLSGPAPRPLARYPTKLEPNRVLIKLPVG